MNNHHVSQTTQETIARRANSPQRKEQPAPDSIFAPIIKRGSVLCVSVGLTLALAGCAEPSDSSTYHVNDVQPSYHGRWRNTPAPVAVEVPIETPTAAHVKTEDEKQSRLAVQLGLALAVKLGTRPASSDDLGDVFAKAIFSRGADALIESTVAEAFEDQSSRVQRQISLVLEAIFEGDLTLSTVGERSRKAELFDWLQARSPEAAQDAKVIDFLYEVYQKGHAH